MCIRDSALDRNGYRVTLLEEKERAGGLIETRNTRQGLTESAAHSFIVTGPVRELCRELGVELVEGRKEGNAKVVLRDRQLRRFTISVGDAFGTCMHVALGPSA